MFDYRVYDYSLIWSAEAYSWTFSFFLASAALNLFDYEKYNPQMKMKKTSSFVLQVSSATSKVRILTPQQRPEALVEYMSELAETEKSSYHIMYQKSLFFSLENFLWS